MRLTLSKKICKEYSLRIAFKENMPQTTLVVALDKSDEAFLKSMQNGSANKIKKAKNK